MKFYDQDPYDARFEWGPEGAQVLAEVCDAVVIVDVLRFSTVVSLWVERGATVFPYRWGDESAPAFAERVDAVLAEGRGQNQGFTLSAASVPERAGGYRVVLPSPNGANVSLSAADGRARVLCGCLRNASAVARAARSLGPTVGVIAAGERWDSPFGDALRPSLEDMIGAGAVLSALRPNAPAPEACAAMAVFSDARSSLLDVLRSCSSGRELLQKGYDDDIAVAAEYDESVAVPIMDDGGFGAMPKTSTAGAERP